jgi:CheY-like chemotaxis protein
MTEKRWEGTKVLVIDDDRITRRMISKLVEGLGCITIQSGNGKHAWETLWENPDVQLIVTDMMMPDMDGRELVQIIRGNQDYRELPILIVSGVLDTKDVEDLLAFGHCRFCRKPLEPGELKGSVSALLK